MATGVDTLFVGGRVYEPGTPAPRRAGAAVRDGRIVAVDEDDVVRELAGRDTEVVDLAGGLLLPGFQDAHVHPVMAGLAMLQCDLHDAVDAQQCVAMVAAYASAHPELDWVVGDGWSLAMFPGGTPTRQALDAVVPDRPVFLANRDGHGAWVNTRALELAAISASTPDPPDGRIEREPDGSPSGTLHEGAADLVQRVAPEPHEDEMHAGLLQAQDLLLSLGITAWQDAAVGAMFGADILPVYLRAAQAGELRARVVGALWWDRARGAEQIPDLVERRAAAGRDRFAATTVKIMQDGVVENWTAAMLAPYLDAHGCHTDNSGISFVDPVALREDVAQLDAAGFQFHVHALGDRAVREALDAMQVARERNGGNDNRHHIAHVQVVHPDDIARFAQLGVTANVQPLWAAHEPQMDELTIPFLGERRAELQYPFAALARAGARLAAGSDWAVSSANPLEGVHVAVNRVAPGQDDVPLYAHNALTLAQALTAYTSGSAYANHLDETGTLGPGSYADLVVLDRDPFAGPPQDIAQTRVVRTYVGGELVHASG
jgi:predicted amidohydrolase YtcJ